MFSLPGKVDYDRLAATQTGVDAAIYTNSRIGAKRESVCYENGNKPVVFLLRSVVGIDELKDRVSDYFFREMTPRTLLAHSSENPKRALARE